MVFLCIATDLALINKIMVHWAVFPSASAGMRHVQKNYIIYIDLDFPGFIDLDGNGTICSIDKHSRKCDLTLFIFTNCHMPNQLANAIE